jgi:hypothetical protein
LVLLWNGLGQEDAVHPTKALVHKQNQYHAFLDCFGFWQGHTRTPQKEHIYTKREVKVFLSNAQALAPLVRR